MTAIGNVGELASPYYLLEVWARRGELDLEPAERATLRRKARALVRDWLGFDLRNQDPDAEWQARRLDLLGLGEAREVETPAGAVPFSLLAWSSDGQQDAVLIADLPGLKPDPDRRAANESDPAATRFELILDDYDGEAGEPGWGLLLAGTDIRVYRRGTGMSQQYLELRLADLVELDDEPTWRAFATVFRASAFVPGDDGVPLIRRIVDESRRHATELASDMRADIVDAAEALIQGALRHPANADLLADASRELLEQLFEETLYELYRVLFVLYAEARDFLPVARREYQQTYSVDHLVELARRGRLPRGGTYFQATLMRLFGLLWEGPHEHAVRLGLDPVGGELFDPVRTALLDRCIIDDEAWGAALLAVAIGAEDGPRGKIGQRGSFGQLGVDQLGSIYEGLLVLEPYLAAEPRVLVLIDGERRVLDPATAKGYRVVRRLEPGDFVLESASGRRKGSGSFYTPHEISEWLTQAALEPLTEPLVERARQGRAEAQAAERELLDLKVCDPAMGSGAFLVQGARVLGRALARIRAFGKERRVTPAMVHAAERVVVRSCIYGVDLNPLAVALAKVSLWLETLERGRPLTFLDAHLHCGDSLVGVSFTKDGEFTAEELLTWPAQAAEGLKTYLKREAGQRGEPVLERLRRRKVPKKPTQATLPGVDAPTIRAALERLAAERVQILSGEDEAETLESEQRARERYEELLRGTDLYIALTKAADFWSAQWFSDGEDAPEDSEGPVVPPGPGDFELALARLLDGAPLPERLISLADAADRVAKRRRFFHWALEFPEVIVDRGGFDAIIGNPPWNTLSPDVTEFFSTYDPRTFRKGVPKSRKAARRAELRLTPEIDHAWRTEARYLYELSNYVRPESGRYKWHAREGNLRKGDANIYRQFVEHSYRLLRSGGRLGQVLPDALYVSSPATGVREHLLRDGVLERCYVFENRRAIFPIDTRIKVVLLTAQRGGGPTERFRAAFFVGKDAATRDRAIGLDALPGVLAGLDDRTPWLAVEQIRTLTPSTWAFPELQTALDAEIAAHCARAVPPLNREERGLRLRYCRELDADRDARRFQSAEWLERERHAVRQGLRWMEPDGSVWWPLVEGALFYNLGFPEAGKEPKYWVDGLEVAAIESRQNEDGTSVTQYYRPAWRDVARAVDERSVIAALLPPKVAAKHKAPTVWGGHLDYYRAVCLPALLSSFVFDYLVRFRGATSLTYGIIDSIPAPTFESLRSLVEPAAEVLCRSEEFDDLWYGLFPGRLLPSLDVWEIGERRARIDAEVARAYGLSLEQFAAVLSTFPNVDRSQPMLPGEPKSFVSRDLTLLAYTEMAGLEPPDVAKLLREIGVDLPEPRMEYRRVDARVERYRQLGAVPYRPTPKGARAPTDPALIDSVREILSGESLTAQEIAEALDEEEKTVAAILKNQVKDRTAFAEGSGKKRRYYVIEDE